MKIAMIGHKRIPSREGGVEIVVEELSTRLVERGHDVVCYNRKGRHTGGKGFKIEHSGEFKGIKIKQVFTLDGKGLAALTSSFAASVCAAFGKYDTVHYHAEGPSAMCILPKLFGKRIVTTIHGLDWQRAKWGGFAKKYLLFGERMAVKYADEIIVLSENTKKYFMETYSRKTVFIPNGIERPETIEAKLITEKMGIKKGEYILFLGRIVPEKNVLKLVEAFKKLNTDKKLVIAGGPSDSAEYYEAVKEASDGRENIIMTGFVQGELLKELYSNAYLYVLPSELEGMPIGLLEAMSYGNCCVVSDIPECSEVVSDKAVVFKRGDVEQLRVKLQELCDNPEKVESYRNSSTDYICRKYDWDSVVDKTLELYEK